MVEEGSYSWHNTTRSFSPAEVGNQGDLNFTKYTCHGLAPEKAKQELTTPQHCREEDALIAGNAGTRPEGVEGGN